MCYNDTAGMLVKYADFFALSEPRKQDLKKYRLRKKLKKVTQKYIARQYAVYDKASGKIEEFRQKSECELDEFFSVDKCLGSEDKLSDEFIEGLEINHLSPDDGFKIRRHIIEGIESDNLNKRSYFLRIQYLLSHFEIIDREVGEFGEDVSTCPFCGDSVRDFMRSCASCGQVLRDIDFNEHALKDASNQFNDFLESLDAKHSKRKDNQVAIEDGDELADLKKHYNRYLSDYEFEDVAEYYNGDVEECVLAFFKNRISNKDDYYNYLYYLSDVALSAGKYEEGIVYLIQLAILSMSAYDSKKGMYDVLELLVNVKLKRSVDLDVLFKKAVDTFEFDEFNKNHKEVYQIFDYALKLN